MSKSTCIACKSPLTKSESIFIQVIYISQLKMFVINYQTFAIMKRKYKILTFDEFVYIALICVHNSHKFCIMCVCMLVTLLSFETYSESPNSFHLYAFNSLIIIFIYYINIHLSVEDLYIHITLRLRICLLWEKWKGWERSFLISLKTNWNI